MKFILILSLIMLGLIILGCAETEIQKQAGIQKEIEVIKEKSNQKLTFGDTISDNTYTVKLKSGNYFISDLNPYKDNWLNNVIINNPSNETKSRIRDLIVEYYNKIDKPGNLKRLDEINDEINQYKEYLKKQIKIYYEINIKGKSQEQLEMETMQALLTGSSNGNFVYGMEQIYVIDPETGEEYYVYDINAGHRILSTLPKYEEKEYIINIRIDAQHSFNYTMYPGQVKNFELRIL